MKYQVTVEVPLHEYPHLAYMINELEGNAIITAAILIRDEDLATASTPTMPLPEYPKRKVHGKKSTPTDVAPMIRTYWQPADDEVLKEYMAKYPIDWEFRQHSEELAQRLGRTAAAVKSRRWKFLKEES